MHRFPDTNRILSTWDRMYVLPTDLSYEPTYADSLAGIAEARGVDVREVLMDVMADGRPLLFLFGNYPGHLDGQVDAINHPQSVFGLSDGGAHCGVLCDASVPTYMLAYMTAGPATRHDAARARRAQDDPGLGAASTASPIVASSRPATAPTSTSSIWRPCACTTRRWSTTSRPAASGSSSGRAATPSRCAPVRSRTRTASTPARCPAASCAAVAEVHPSTACRPSTW